MARFSAALAASAFLLALSAPAFAADAGSSGAPSLSSPGASNSGMTPSKQGDKKSHSLTPGQNGTASQEQSAQMPSVPNGDGDQRSTESKSDQSISPGIGKRNNDAGNDRPASNSSSMH